MGNISIIMISNTNTLFLLATILAAAPFSARADSIEIVNWDVSEFATTDKEGESINMAKAFVGETVTWSSSNCPLVEFDDESAFESCNIAESTTLSEDGNYVLTVPSKKKREPRMLRKGPKGKKGKARFYGCGEQTACDGGSKLKVFFSKKKFTKKVLASCEGEGTENPISVIPGKGRMRKCWKQCMMTAECLGFQYERKTNPEGERPKEMISTCTLYDVYPEATGETGDLLPKEKVFCLSVQTDNTVGGD